MLPLTPLVLSTALLGGGAGADLTALAASSPRPPECGGWSGERPAGGRWKRVARAAFVGRCEALARGYSLLGADPAAALVVANSLVKAWPGHAAPAVLRAEALARIGRFAEAWASFQQAMAIAPDTPKSPSGLRSLAVVAARTGHTEAARTALAKLLPRVSLLAEPGDLLRVHVEAAALAMLEGPSGLDEAIAYLTSARENRTSPELGEIVVAMLALALDRAGHTQQAKRMAEGASGPWRLEALVDPDEPAARGLTLPYLPPGEVHALIALLAEPVDRELAEMHWQLFVEERGNGAFVEHARRRMSGLR